MLDNDKPTASLAIEKSGDRELIVTRRFDAPAQSIFDALTRPEHVSQWFGGDGQLADCTIDLVEGGSYQFVTIASDGSRHAFSGAYRVIQIPNRLVYTERYEQIPGAESVVSVQLSEAGGQTLLIERIEYASEAARDGHLASGMEHGVRAAFERLAELVG